MPPSQGNVRLRALFPAFDLPIDGRPETEPVVIAFALRGIRYYAESMRLAVTSPDAAFGVLRSLVDLTILLRWIEDAPKRRIRLYFASDDLERMRTSDDWNTIRTTFRGLPPLAPVFGARDRHTIIRRAHLLRRVAKAHRDRVSAKETDPLVPTIRARAELTADCTELYFMSRMLSQQVHVTGRTLAGDRLERRKSGTHIRPKAAIPPELVRGLAGPAICILLASASRQLGLGLESDLDVLRLQLVGWSAPASP